MNISVIIPAYNAETLVTKAVESALYHPEVQEVLLVEDGSSDATLEVCKNLALQYPKVTLLQHAGGGNRGAGATRNLGIQNATQEFIAFLDADDYFTEIRFQKEKEVFHKNPEADGVYGAIGVDYLDKDGAKAWEGKGLNQESLTTVNKPIDPAHLFEFLIGIQNPKNYKGYYSIDGLTLKRNVLLASEIVFPASLRLHQDTVFLWQTAFCLKLYTGEYERPIAMRGVHTDNRFIHTDRLHRSRSKQFKVLRDWAIDNKLKPEICYRFQQKYFKHFINSRSKVARIPSYVLMLLTDSTTRHDFGKKQLKYVWTKCFE